MHKQDAICISLYLKETPWNILSFKSTCKKFKSSNSNPGPPKLHTCHSILVPNTSIAQQLHAKECHSFSITCRFRAQYDTGEKPEQWKKKSGVTRAHRPASTQVEWKWKQTQENSLWEHMRVTSLHNRCAVIMLIMIIP